MNGFWRVVRFFLRRVWRHPFVAVSVIALTAGDRLILIQRRDTGQWSLPGGMMDWGETILETGARELAEETGLHLKQFEGLVGVYSDPQRDPRIHAVCIAIAARVVGEPQVLDAKEVRAVQSFPLNDLPLAHLAHDHARQLQDYLSGHLGLT
ncbi:NUDIX domain-containing protein [Thermosynechococcus sp.]|uniref:NUDIX domain-containing protein n=1 Tax=Thermosynechococcus sp. TaxID=2814275 RepID=UPI00391A8614